MNQKKIAAQTPNAKRHQTKESARLEVYGKKEILFCRMSNLSSTGAFFEIVNANYTPKAHDLVNVTINLNQINKSYTVHGEVVWSKGLNLGVMFIKQKILSMKLARLSKAK